RGPIASDHFVQVRRQCLKTGFSPSISSAQDTALRRRRGSALPRLFAICIPSFQSAVCRAQRFIEPGKWANAGITRHLEGPSQSGSLLWRLAYTVNVVINQCRPVEDGHGRGILAGKLVAVDIPDAVGSRRNRVGIGGIPGRVPDELAAVSGAVNSF